MLIREDNGILGKTVCYTYDLGGNLTSRKEYALTQGTLGTVQKTDTFTYRSSGWKDQLLSYNGQTFAYDGYGNPTSYRGMSMTWKRGKQLAGIVNGNTSLTFAYDNEGKRIRKTAGSTVTRYYWNGSQLTGMTRGSDTVQFVYDAAGKPFLMRVNGQSDYYYLYNGQEDVVGLVDRNNTVVVEYTYDSWGKALPAADTSGASVGSLNPFRYRGYVYDQETGLYYLGNRYYDPVTGRFVNADELEAICYETTSVQGKNLYQYCLNNPVNMLDEDGEWPKWENNVAKIAIGAAAIGVGVAVTVASGERGAVAVKKVVNAAIDGFADGFMTGGIMEGVSQVASGVFKLAAKAGVPTGRKGGIQFGKIKVLSPDSYKHANSGGTLIKLGSTFRIDVGSNSLLHLHLPKVKAHIPLGIIGSALYGGAKWFLKGIKRQK